MQLATISSGRSLSWAKLAFGQRLTPFELELETMELRAMCKTCDWALSADELSTIESAAEEHQQENPDHSVRLSRPDANLSEYR